MLWLSLVICVPIFWQPSVSCSAHASDNQQILSDIDEIRQTCSSTEETNHCDSRPKPVDLAHSCIRVNSNLGHNDDVPIILIHGLSSYKEVWNGMNEVLALETGKKVCIVDLRNHGESPWTDEVDTATMTEDIKHMLDKLKIPKAVLLGHSLGGKIAVHLSLNYPERVDKVIIEDMRPNGLSPEGLQEVLLYINLLKDVNKFIPQGVSQKEAKEIFLKNFNDYLAKSNTSLIYDDPDLFPIICKDGKCRWSTNTLIFHKMIENVNSVVVDSSGRFDGPALFMYGTESNFKVADDESNIKKMFPNAKLVGVKGAGHVVHTFPEFMPEVIKFINEK